MLCTTFKWWIVNSEYYACCVGYVCEWWMIWNDDRDIVSSGKGIWSIRRYANSTGILESYRRWLWGGESRRRFIWPCLRFDIWADQNRTYGLTLCIWKLYMRFEIETDKSDNWCRPLSLIQCTSLSEIESSVYGYRSVYLWYELL